MVLESQTFSYQVYEVFTNISLSFNHSCPRRPASSKKKTAVDQAITPFNNATVIYSCIVVHTAVLPVVVTLSLSEPLSKASPGYRSLTMLL